MNQRRSQNHRCEHLDSSQISISQKTSMNRYQMRKSLSGKLIQQTDSTVNACELLGPAEPALSSMRHSDERVLRLRVGQVRRERARCRT